MCVCVIISLHVFVLKHVWPWIHSHIKTTLFFFFVFLANIGNIDKILYEINWLSVLSLYVWVCKKKNHLKLFCILLGSVKGTRSKNKEKIKNDFWMVFCFSVDELLNNNNDVLRTFCLFEMPYIFWNERMIFLRKSKRFLIINFKNIKIIIES